MPQSNERLAQLLKQFPQLNEILARPLLPLQPTGNKRTHIDRLEITVERADVSLIYRRGDNIGLQPPHSGRGSELYATRKERGEEIPTIGKQGEYLFAVYASHSGDAAFAMLDWPVDVTPGQHTVYARKIFDRVPSNQVQYLAWVTVNVWFLRNQRTGGLDAFLDRRVHVTIYNPPPLGFEHLLRTAKLGDSYLTGRELLEGVVRKEPEWLEISNELEGMALQFNNAVYRTGMKRLMDASRMKGMSATFGNIEVRTWIGAGRVMVTIEEKDKCYLSFAGIEEYDHVGGWQGLQGTMPQIRSMMERFIDAWRAVSDPSQVFKDNPNVTPFPGF